MELILALVLGAVAAALIRKVLRERVRAAAHAEMPTAATVRLQPARWCEFEIEGEGEHQAALKAIAGAGGPEGVTHHCQAVLVPEPDDPDNPDAVLVAIEGRHVGRMRREDAALYGEWLAELGKAGETASCPAFILGGAQDADGGRAPYGVKLGLAWPPELERPPETGPQITAVALARLRGAALSDEEAWRTPPVDVADDAELARAFAGGLQGCAIAFVGWSEERLPYFRAVGQAAGMVVRDGPSAGLALLCAGPRAHARHAAAAPGAFVVSGAQLQALMAQAYSDEAQSA